MTTDQQTSLHLAARKLVQAQETAALLSKLVASDRALGDLSNCLSDTLNELGEALTAAGATHTPTGPTTDTNGLEALRKIEESRTEAQVFLCHLQGTLYAAEQLDKKRGNWVGDQADTLHGETPGTGYAEAIQAIQLKLLEREWPGGVVRIACPCNGVEKGQPCHATVIKEFLEAEIAKMAEH